MAIFRKIAQMLVAFHLWMEVMEEIDEEDTTVEMITAIEIVILILTHILVAEELMVLIVVEEVAETIEVVTEISIAVAIVLELIEILTVAQEAVVVIVVEAMVADAIDTIIHRLPHPHLAPIDTILILILVVAMILIRITMIVEDCSIIVVHLHVRPLIAIPVTSVENQVILQEIVPLKKLFATNVRKEDTFQKTVPRELRDNSCKSVFCPIVDILSDLKRSVCQQ